VPQERGGPKHQKPEQVTIPLLVLSQIWSGDEKMAWPRRGFR
jgi:hypothetical protein